MTGGVGLYCDVLVSVGFTCCQVTDDCRQYLWTVRWGHGYTTTLPLEVFTQTNFVADFIRLKLNFVTKNRFLSHPLDALHLQLVKARGRFFIR